jgi:hypothetical protein
MFFDPENHFPPTNIEKIKVIFVFSPTSAPVAIGVFTTPAAFTCVGSDKIPFKAQIRSRASKPKLLALLAILE